MPENTSPFQLRAPFEPFGDQPAAIEKLAAGVERGERDQLLLGVTGSGKTFTMANVIQKVGKPALILAPNKTLAAQLADEFREFFPENAVDYFVSDYDFYQPEAYKSGSDTFFEKQAVLNEELTKQRHRTTFDLATRRDVVVCASVSAIFSNGYPAQYFAAATEFRVGEKIGREAFLRQLVKLQFTREDFHFSRGNFRVRGDSVEVFLPFAETAFRFEFFGEELEKISEVDPLLGEILGSQEKVLVVPAHHAIVDRERIAKVLPLIREEMEERAALFRANAKDSLAERLEARVLEDIAMLEETGWVRGIENYTRYFGWEEIVPGAAPATLLDYFPARKEGLENENPSPFEGEARWGSAEDSGTSAVSLRQKPSPDPSLKGRGESAPTTDSNPPKSNIQNQTSNNFLLFVDESHLTIPQISAMHAGNRRRLTELVDFGWRLPSAFDNRPLTFEEFDKQRPETIFVSATPGKFERAATGAGESFTGFQKNPRVAEQIIRPTGLPDPPLEVIPKEGSWARVLVELKENRARGERSLLLSLTQKGAEELSKKVVDEGFKAGWIHAETKTLDRQKILRQLKEGELEVLVGINLLREGLDLPAASLVVIFDADKPGFLRSRDAILQMAGRAARNIRGRVLLLADRETPAMAAALEETARRRARQEEFNAAEGITPR